MSKGKWPALSDAERTLVDQLILEQRLPVAEIRKRTRASMPYVYRRFRKLGVKLPIERAGLYHPLSDYDKRYIREHPDLSAETLADHLGKRKNLVRGYLVDLEVESLFLTSKAPIKEIAQVLGLSSSRVRLALTNLGYRFDWIPPTLTERNSGDDGE